ERYARRAEHLPEAGHARHEVEAAALPAVDAAILVGHERPRPDEAHLAANHVDELGQLVQIGAAKEAAHTRDAWVLGHLEEALGALVARHELRLHRVGAVVHRAELEDPEGLAVAADAPLAEQDRT